MSLLINDKRKKDANSTPILICTLQNMNNNTGESIRNRLAAVSFPRKFFTSIEKIISRRNELRTIKYSELGKGKGNALSN